MTCFLRLEVRLAKMLPIAPKVVIRLVQVYLGIGESKAVNLFQPRKFFLVLCSLSPVSL